MWDPQWRSLAAAHHLVRLDLRGFGRSPLPPAPFAHAGDGRLNVDFWVAPALAERAT